MNKECLKFSDLCDYYENNINDPNMVNIIIKHLENCEECKNEFIRIKNMFEILHDYSCNDVDCKDISDIVIKKLKFRSRRRKFLHRAPAIAAAVLLFVGVTYYWGGSEEINDTIASTVTQSQIKTEEIIDIMNTNHAKLLRVTDLYVEGEIIQSKFNHLRKDLGTRQVTSTLAHKSRLDVRNSWRRGIEEVGTGTNSGSKPKTVKYIRFRIYK